MRWIRDILESAQPKYLPFATAIVLAGILMSGFAVLLVPAMLLIKGIPTASWPGVYISAFAVLVPIALAASVLALIFGLLAYSKIKTSICVILFGIAMPLCVVGFLSMIGLILDGTFLQGIDTPEGHEDVLFLLALFGFLGVALYWAGERELRKGDRDNA